MKKCLKAILSFILMFILVSCGEKTEKTVFVSDNNGIKSTITFYHKGDKINKQHLHTTINYEESGQDEDILRIYMETFEERYKNIKGYVQKLKFQKKEFILDVKTNYNELDVEKYSILDIPFANDIDKETSLKEQSKLMKDSGYTKKK